MQVPRVFKFILKYVTPTYLLLVFAAFCWQNLGAWIRSVAEEPLRQGAMLLILATAILLVVCTAVGARRWRAAGLDIDGRYPAEDREVRP